jgi:CheY-like chemotaxis protein
MQVLVRLGALTAASTNASPSLPLVLRELRVQRAGRMPSQRESGVQGLSGARRVLIVDDQEDIAELIAIVLGEHGHEVKVAHDGEIALALALEFRPQVALLDIGLPVRDGLKLGALMLATPELADCRLIAVSGYCSARDRMLSRAAGFETHLAKPLGIAARAKAPLH